MYVCVYMYMYMYVYVYIQYVCVYVYVYVYSALRKYSYFFSTSVYTPYTIMIKQKTGF